ncbi:MAG: FAD-binding oxidoreductase [Acidobacteria bacterium]|nr:FAD-binding oxidoreductase [Acidobacteriota bacterium]
MSTHSIHARRPKGATGLSSESTAESLAESLIDRQPDVLLAHSEDAAHYSGGHADGVARPRTEQEIAHLLTHASRVLPVGAQSSVTGGATPDGGLVLSTARLVSIQESGQHHFRVGSGVPLTTLQELLHSTGRWYAPSPTYTGAFAGGVVATNAAGAATFKYGTTRQWTDGLTVVLACGHVLAITRGQCVADPVRGFEITCDCGTRTVQPGTYVMPAVPKCSAGYFAAPEMDLVDLFIGAEGTLGVVTDVLFRVLAEPPAVAWALVSVRSESDAITLVDALRRASQETWRTKDPVGLDISAIEHVDRRCLEILREDGIDRKQDITIPADAAVMLLVQLELPRETTPAVAFEQVSASLSDDATDGAIVRFCRMLAAHGALDDTEMAWPGDQRRIDQFLAFRESAPAGVNRRVGDAKRDHDARIEKTAADMIVLFEHFGTMVAIYREGYRARGLDFAIWGHISDGNVHPNVIPRSFDDVVAGREAILEFGRAVARLGGCPLAEHGVGRSSVKQALLRQLYGDEGLNQMRAIKSALDPRGVLAPGVLFPA